MRLLSFLAFVFSMGAAFAQNPKPLPKKIDQALGGTVYVPSSNFSVLVPADALQLPADDTLLMSPYPSAMLNVSDFFIQKTEITNAQYRAFVHWVRDSLAHARLGHVIAIDTNMHVDWRQHLDWSIGGELDAHFFYHVDSVSFFDVRKLEYNLDGKEIRIYPDTLCWLRDFSSAYNEPMSRYYFSSPQYDNYPVVGINWWQATAYCHWKQRQINQLLEKEGFSSVTIRLPSAAEWQRAALGAPISPALEAHKIYPWQGNLLIDADGKYLANFGTITDQYGIRIKEYIEQPSNGKQKNKTANCQGLYTSQTGCFSPNDIGLYDMAGNVAEWTSDMPDLRYLRRTADSSDTAALTKFQQLDDEAFYRADSISVRAWAMDVFRWNATRSAQPAISLDDFVAIYFPRLPLIWRDINIAYRGGEKRIALGGSWAQPSAYMLVGAKAAYTPYEAHTWLGFRPVIVWNK